MTSFEAWCNCKGTGVQPVPLQDEVIYAICQYCDGAGVITIKGEKMEEQENKTEFSYDKYVELQKRFQEIRDEMYKVRSDLNAARDVVLNFFQERYTDLDYPDDLTFDIDEINTLLLDIGASELSKRFDATATVEITFKVLADDKYDAESIINDYIADLSISVNNEDDYEVESFDVHVAE
jgi:hypothetical protein